jgi:hypothetical protein
VLARFSTSTSVFGANTIDMLAETVMVVGRCVNSRVASTDILELAMAREAMFEWLSY